MEKLTVSRLTEEGEKIYSVSETQLKEVVKEAQKKLLSDLYGRNIITDVQLEKELNRISNN